LYIKDYIINAGSADPPPLVFAEGDPPTTNQIAEGDLVVDGGSSGSPPPEVVGDD
jgi:hypothetical protein